MESNVEKYIKKYTRNCSNQIWVGEYHPWLTPQNAESVAMIAKQETLKAIIQWIKKNAERYMLFDHIDEVCHMDKQFYNDLMETIK